MISKNIKKSLFSSLKKIDPKVPKFNPIEFEPFKF